jgi:hypothetical protein
MRKNASHSSRKVFAHLRNFNQNQIWIFFIKFGEIPFISSRDVKHEEGPDGRTDGEPPGS